MDHRIRVLLCELFSLQLRPERLCLDLRAAVGEHKGGTFLAAEVQRPAAHMHPDLN